MSRRGRSKDNRIRHVEKKKKSKRAIIFSSGVHREYVEEHGGDTF